jgi:hypothetical protein
MMFASIAQILRGLREANAVENVRAPQHGRNAITIVITYDTLHWCRESEVRSISLGLTGLWSALPNAGPSTPLKYASLRKTGLFLLGALDSGH